MLGFDTATPAVSVALHDGERVIASASALDARRHSELLTPMIAKVLADAGVPRTDLDAIAVGVGPGPYTGLRVGVVTARVLGSVLGLSVHGVCSLDIIAASASPGREFLVATDARRQEVYWACYSAAGQRSSGPQVSRPADVPRGLAVAGEAALIYPDLSDRPLKPAFPSAAQLAVIAAGRRARGEPPEPAVPLYLRRPDAREPGKPKRVTP